MKTFKSKNIDDYISGFPKDVQNRLQQIRATIQKAAPQAEEAMGYGVPALKVNGNAFSYFAAFKNHIGFYPAPRGVESFKKELSAYRRRKSHRSVSFKQPRAVRLNHKNDEVLHTGEFEKCSDKEKNNSKDELTHSSKSFR